MGEINVVSFYDLLSEKADPGSNDYICSAVDYIPEQLLELVEVNYMYLSPPHNAYIKYKELVDEKGDKEAREEIYYDVMYEDYINVNREAKQQIRQIIAKASVRDVWIVVYQEDIDTYPQILKDELQERIKT